MPRAANPPLAIAFMLLATMFIAATMLLAKALGTDALGVPLHPLQVSHGRFLFAFLAVSSVSLILRPRLRTGNPGLHVLRSSFGFAGVSMMFAAAAFIPLSDATAISFLNPIFAMILAVLFLSERVGPYRWLAACIALVGALILLRPGPGSFQAAALLALGAAICFGAEITVMKRLSRQEAPLQILLINNALGLAISTCAVVAYWQPPTGAQWAALAALGVLMASAQAAYVNAIARADTSLVVPFSYATLVFAALYDFALFSVVPDAVSITGAGIIIAGALLLAWREARSLRKLETKPL